MFTEDKFVRYDLVDLVNQQQKHKSTQATQASTLHITKDNRRTRVRELAANWDCLDQGGYTSTGLKAQASFHNVFQTGRRILPDKHNLCGCILNDCGSVTTLVSVAKKKSNQL
ncbi:hypothetical protein Q8A73_021247 [Channa argus]|nr:hypothetical protein Q8A73_021247 [Channa argus]